MNNMLKKSTGSEAIVLPAPVTLPNLRRHFKEVYGLNLTQTEVMLESSSKSLMQVFENASKVLNQENNQEQLGPVFHGLKGLLLNMGENEWAAVARDVEEKLKKKFLCDFVRIIKDMQEGLVDILFYTPQGGTEKSNRDKGKKLPDSGRGECSPAEKLSTLA